MEQQSLSQMTDEQLQEQLKAIDSQLQSTEEQQPQQTSEQPPEPQLEDVPTPSSSSPPQGSWSNAVGSFGYNQDTNTISVDLNHPFFSGDSKGRESDPTDFLQAGVVNAFGKTVEGAYGLADGGLNLIGGDLPNLEVQTVKGGEDNPLWGIGEGLTRFATDWMMGGQLLRSWNITNKVGGISKGATQGALTDYFGWGAHEERLSNAINSTPLKNPISEYLAASPNDSEVEGRLKNVLEGGLIGASLEGVITALKQYKTISLIRRVLGQDRAEEYLAKNAPEGDPLDTIYGKSEAPTATAATPTEKPTAPPEAPQPTPKPTPEVEAAATVEGQIVRYGESKSAVASAEVFEQVKQAEEIYLSSIYKLDELGVSIYPGPNNVTSKIEEVTASLEKNKVSLSKLERDLKSKTWESQHKVLEKNKYFKELEIRKQQRYLDRLKNAQSEYGAAASLYKEAQEGKFPIRNSETRMVKESDTNFKLNLDEYKNMIRSGDREGFLSKASKLSQEDLNKLGKEYGCQ